MVRYSSVLSGKGWTHTALDAPSHFTVVDCPGWISLGHSVNAKP